MENQKEKKFEFSKIMASVTISLLVVVVLYSLVLCSLTLDSTFLDNAIELLKPAALATIGFYYWKARGENVIKLKKIYGKDADAAIAAMNNQTLPSDSEDSFHF